MSRKKILVITPRFPYPVIGGDRLRIFEICRELSKTYELTLASLCESQSEIDYLVPDDSVFSSVHRVYLPKWKSYLNCLRALPTQTPLQVAYYSSSKFAKLVKNLSKDNNLVLPHLIRTADYAKDLETRKVLEMTDAISMNYFRVSETKNHTGIKGLIYNVEKNRLNHYEKLIAKSFDCNVLVSKFDREFLFKCDKVLFDKSLVCSNGVDVEKLTFDFSPSGNFVVFIGNMYSAQNMDAALWFASEAMPLLRENGDFTFKVIGRIKPENERKLKSYEGVIVTGAVDDIVEHARGAIAGVCPVRLAAGVQNKILEYMALGLPTITTTTGLEGLEAKPDLDILVADTPPEIVGGILRLKSDNQLAERIANSANQYVKEHHSWAGKLRPLNERISELLS
ncbi:glycosyltransferase family 4 protein [Enterovibrio sp. ZSDZ35]|uniref:Glycosyltransferase family 4 protein n=1 Tax=Enterovibrio qingdaonensis TaxID=2899818 RepID=A0ABT5QN90_9GAMM|nr:glycosyltransferase family 4 protein [Enterovibrio sp. ZSDZ35]MDD1782447.1 glycosyltransferase family 4 protein [Enterovibrio sp. ZSDZ35]